MPQANPGYLFYSKYFNLTPAALVNTDAIERLKNIETLSPIKRVIYSNANNIGGNTEPFKLVTTYPGLLIGSGYSHDVSKGMEGENALKIGFYFDHTTGMPVIPGSSIKGAVRGWFPSQYKKRAVDDSFRNPRYELISHLINNITSIILNHENAEDRKKIDMFEKEMFEGVYENKPKTIYNRDIFFDAVPVEIQSNFKSSQGRLFYNDYLTPHKNRNNRPELDPFSDPNPIQFLKVMPKVVYEFKFDLKNSAVIPEMDAGKKRTLIQSIILFSGLGAKTNVGYGQFISEEDSKKLNYSTEVANPEKEERSNFKSNENKHRKNSARHKKDEIPQYDSLEKFKGQKKIEQAATQSVSDTWPDISVVNEKEGSVNAKILGIENQVLIVQPYIKGLTGEHTIKIILGRFTENPYKIGQEIKIQITKKTGQAPDYILQCKLIK